MIPILLITVVLILIYLAYPVFLSLFTSKRFDTKDIGTVDSVSVIFLSYNGKHYIREKVNFLLCELAGFPRHELIIIDDFSTDGTDQILAHYNNFNDVSIIQKSSHKGIAHSMNMAVNLSNYDYLLFCDQRQKLSANIVKNILEQLKSSTVGAVSGCLSCMDKTQNHSILRKHENYIKSQESKSGCLIGVYGPFYAIKKQFYSPVPENVILDDLYLSLKILQKAQIRLDTNCIITDEDFSSLYSFHRTKRYLMGFIQLLKEKDAIKGLSKKQKLMLFWHKYLRLSIPIFLFASYISLGFMITDGLIFLISFLLFTFLIVISVSSPAINRKLRFINLIRMNIFYFIALLDILFLSKFRLKSIR
jgi:cellulose synthase/poly-beta-1,6-N-acetylglucosamine synthase-like glycosyltransferase